MFIFNLNMNSIKKIYCFLILVTILSCKAQNNEKRRTYYEDVKLPELVIKNQSIFNLINDVKIETRRIYKLNPDLIIFTLMKDSTLRIETMYNFHSEYRHWNNFIGALYTSDHILVLFNNSENNKEQFEKFFSLKENKEIFKIPFGHLMDECYYYSEIKSNNNFKITSKTCSIDMIAP